MVFNMLFSFHNCENVGGVNELISSLTSDFQFVVSRNIVLSNLS